MLKINLFFFALMFLLLLDLYSISYPGESENEVKIITTGKNLQLLTKEYTKSLNKTRRQIKRDPHHYELVLLTTDDGWTERIQNKSRLYSSLIDVYCREYNFRPVIFTTTPELIAVYNRTCATIIQDFRVNRYNIPIITNMFSIAKESFSADYYGYVNADILIQNNIFFVLQYLKEQSQRGVICKQHELAGRVYEVDYSKLPYNLTTLDEVNTFFRTVSPGWNSIRNRGSADYFFFSKEALPLVTNETHEAVIGRREIDNYLMGIMWNGGEGNPVLRDLIDGTVLVRGIHIGRDGFFNRKKKQSGANERWNFNVRDAFKIHHGYLNERGNCVIRMFKNKTCCDIYRIPYVVRT